jgi:nucleotide-binding universal stress UspA family protein
MTSQAEAEQVNRRRIIVGVDGSEESRAALRWSAEEADLRDTELEAVYAWVPPRGVAVSPTMQAAAPVVFGDPQKQASHGEKVLEQTVTEVFAGQPPARLTWSVVEGNAAGVLISQSIDADLLVVGSRGHGGFSGLLAGSVCEQCVRYARCSVVVVRPQK